MLLMRVGRSPVSHSFLIRVLDKMGFDRPDRKVIIKRYFSPTINHYKLKKFESDE
jgi:hypothetical protein